MTTHAHFEMVTLPRVDGETIERRVRQRYLSSLSAQPKLMRDFTSIPTILECLADLPGERLEKARAHLENAENEDFPHEVRVHHFDLAGSCMYDQLYSRKEIGLHEAFRLWRQAGGF